MIRFPEYDITNQYNDWNLWPQSVNKWTFVNPRSQLTIRMAWCWKWYGWLGAGHFLCQSHEGVQPFRRVCVCVSVGFRIGSLSTARWLGMLRRAKKGGWSKWRSICSYLQILNTLPGPLDPFFTLSTPSSWVFICQKYFEPLSLGEICHFFYSINPLCLGHICEIWYSTDTLVGVKSLGRHSG